MSSYARATIAISESASSRDNGRKRSNTDPQLSSHVCKNSNATLSGGYGDEQAFVGGTQNSSETPPNLGPNTMGISKLLLLERRQHRRCLSELFRLQSKLLRDVEQCRAPRALRCLLVSDCKRGTGAFQRALAEPTGALLQSVPNCSQTTLQLGPGIMSTFVIAIAAAAAAAAERRG
jgi:hypothetical protein